MGAYGTCPSSAAEAIAAAFGATVAPAAVAAGETLTVTGEGCFSPLAGAVLRQDGTPLGPSEVTEPAPDGSFSIVLPVPADAPPGPLEVQVDCGHDGAMVLSATLQAAVIAPEPVAPLPASPVAADGADRPPAAAPVVAAPRYAG